MTWFAEVLGDSALAAVVLLLCVVLVVYQDIATTPPNQPSGNDRLRFLQASPWPRLLAVAIFTSIAVARFARIAGW